MSLTSSALPVPQVGSEVVFERVLMIGGGEDEAEVGGPVVEGARVRAQLVSDLRGPKIIVFKFKRRKGYRRRRGHRQDMQRFPDRGDRTGGRGV